MRVTVYDSPEIFIKSDTDGTKCDPVQPPVEEMPVYWRAYSDDGDYSGDGYIGSVDIAEAYLLTMVGSMWGATLAKLYDRNTNKCIGDLN